MADNPSLHRKRMTAEVGAMIVNRLLSFPIRTRWEERIVRWAERRLLNRLQADVIETRDDLAVVNSNRPLTSDARIEVQELPASDRRITVTPKGAPRNAQLRGHASFTEGAGLIRIPIHVMQRCPT